ncbi:radical SAM family heme chaperone HemW [Hyphomicrobium sp. 99]|uniref:radical SAM family heme chaperone HemW n=1 Tax=Hyphomicrobium sp. 99 TaxID=1163419 RepID=UPI0005F883A7|nr:radical SAM family heme chaperone HemW [Hyphomicrobium sp. 99]
MSDRDTTFGVYIHWPFCAQKCPYCDFNSHVRFKGWDEARFLAAYKREIDWVAEHIGPRTVTSIFFGGGTPSLMQADTVAAIIEHIGKRWGIAGQAEITLEANPGSVEAGRFRGFREAGVNRVSIGVQSLRDEELRKLGRIHSVAEAKAALEIARGTFERFSFDLIYARPGQTADDWRVELAEALDLAGDHLSLYQLTIEPDTPYAALHAAGKLVIPDDHDASALYEITEEMTGKRGLAAYEVSNYARPGSESRHNLLYWRYGEYAGIGPGAHGRILIEKSRTATVAERNPEEWAARVEEAGHGFTEMTKLARAEQADEMLLMGLRLSEGIDLGQLAELGGARPSAAAIAELESLGLLQSARQSSATPGDWRRNELDDIVLCAGPGLAPEKIVLGPDRIRVTPEGRLVLNAVVAKLSKCFQPAERMDKLRAAS